MEILIPEFKIERRVRAMAHKISEEHKASGCPYPPVMICVLNGGFAFFSDLVKDMGIDIQIDFVRAKSYNGKDNSGGVKITKDLEIHCKAKRVYIVDDIVHYCVANMPGGVPRTSTLALNKATLPFLSKLAKDGYKKALKDDPNFLAGLNVHKGSVTYKAVADVFGHSFVSPNEAII